MIFFEHTATLKSDLALELTLNCHNDVRKSCTFQVSCVVGGVWRALPPVGKMVLMMCRSHAHFKYLVWSAACGGMVLLIAS